MKTRTAAVTVLLFTTTVCGQVAAQFIGATAFNSFSADGAALWRTSPFDANVSPPASAGWARSAATLGYISAAVVLAGGIISEDGISGESGLIIGSVTTAYFAVIVPVIASGARSARTGGAKGDPGWRMAGWISYGLALADAALLIGLGASDIGVPGASSAVGVLGALACISMAVDANASASQAEASAARWKPTIGYAAVDGRIVPALGVSIAF